MRSLNPKSRIKNGDVLSRKANHSFSGKIFETVHKSDVCQNLWGKNPEKGMKKKK
jgi:hypothetical protein